MSTQTCVTCPSAVTGKVAADHFGVSSVEAGSYIFCSRFGHVLGDHNGMREGLAERYGASCPSHGKPVPTTLDAAPLPGVVYEPRPDLLTVLPASQRPTFCGDCTKKDDSGITACAATGNLLFNTKQTETAQACSFGAIGNPNAVVGNRLAEWTTTPVALSATRVNDSGQTGSALKPPTKASTKATVPSAPIILEPTNYNSDAKVSPDHAAKGIQAWRRVTSPKGQDHFLPIFRTDFFSEEEQAKIPKSGADYGDPSLYIDHDDILVEFAVQSYTKDLNLVFIGEPGTGKTEGARYIAWQLNAPFDRITYTEDTDPDDVLGFFHFGEYEAMEADGTVVTKTGTYLKVGALPKMWQTPGVKLSDEPNLPCEAIVQTYRSMNDSSRVLTVSGQKFIRHDYCFHVMAMNPHYDFRNIGAKPMASADSRRLTFHLMTPPTEAQIKDILQRAILTLDGVAIKEDVMKVIIDAGKDLRDMTKNNLLPDFWTTSQEVKVARLVPDFGLVGAYRRAYFNYIDPAIADLAVTAVKSHIPAGSDFA